MEKKRKYDSNVEINKLPRNIIDKVMKVQAEKIIYDGSDTIVNVLTNRLGEINIDREEAEYNNIVKFLHEYEYNHGVNHEKEILTRAGFPESFIEWKIGKIKVLNQAVIFQITEDAKSIYDFSEMIKPYNEYASLVVLSLEIDPNPTNIYGLLKQLGFDLNNIRRIFEYPSGRPRTEMRRIVNVPTGNVPPNNILKNSTDVLIDSRYLNRTGQLEEDMWIPVVRYGKSSDEGYCYTCEDPTEKFCGKFYYYEPGSNIYLHAKKVLITQNKFTAMLHLFDTETINYVINTVDKHGNIIDFNTFDESCYEGYYDPLCVELNYQKWGDFFNALKDGSYDVGTYKSSLYAIEDRFDQLICKRAKLYGFDVVIFSMMTGQSRIVSELMDVREDSYIHLIRG